MSDEVYKQVSLYNLGYHWEDDAFVRPPTPKVILSQRGASAIDHELVQRHLRSSPLGLSEKTEVGLEVEERTKIVMLRIPGLKDPLPVDLLDLYFQILA